MSRWRALGRGRRERELEEEIEAHLALAARERMERGEDPRAAELSARREFGSRALVQETTREMWGWSWLSGLGQDVRYAIRGMRRSPAFSAVAVLSLALGIGANCAIFSLVETVLLRMLPVARPEQLVELLQKYPGEPRGNGYWTWRSYEHLRDHNDVFTELFGTSVDNRAQLRAEGSEAETGIAEYVTGNYFGALGVKAAVGRTIGRGEEGVAVVSWALWNRVFHRDPGVVGKRLVVNDEEATIVGVAPRAYVGLRVEADTDVWLAKKPGRDGLILLGRLRRGVGIEQARAEIGVLYRFTIEERAAKSSDPQVRRLRVEVEPAGHGLATVRDRFGQRLMVLMAAVGVLLLLACVNLASMLLARGAAREREMALRTSLGASRGRLLRQVLTESLMLSAAGTLAGGVVAYAGASALLRLLASGRLHEQVHLRVHPDAAMLLFAAGAAVLAALLFGAAPAWRAFRTVPASPLRHTGKAGETRGGRLFGRALVAAQVALSMLLLSAAAVFIGNLWDLEHADLGFHRDHVLLVTLDASGRGYSGERLAGAYRDLLERLEQIPGVRSASLSAPTPLLGAGASGMGTFEGFLERPEDRRWISIAYVAPKYFETLGTPLVEGRGFRYEDGQTNVVIISRSLARQYFAGRNPIGKHVTLEHVTLVKEPRTYEIVGVAGDANYMEIREAEHRTVYVPAFRDGRVGADTFLIRTAVDPRSAAADVRRAVGQAAPGIPVARVSTLREQIDASIVPQRLMAALAGFFGGLGAVLAGIGLYGLLAYTVARRTSEIGVRLALGASAGDVTWMVLGDALATVALGLAAGTPMAIWGRLTAAKLIPDLQGVSGLPLAAAAGGMIAVALLAAYGPARRAARVDPMEALRQE